MTTTPGPLHTFLRAHDDRGLETYLFLHAMASTSDPYCCVLPSGAWVRVLGLADAATDTSARAAVSKVMKRLEDRKLITRTRRRRTAVATLLREDGSGEPYELPTSGRTAASAGCSCRTPTGSRATTASSPCRPRRCC